MVDRIPTSITHTVVNITHWPELIGQEKRQLQLLSVLCCLSIIVLTLPLSPLLLVLRPRAIFEPSYP